jgi:hypothetical protein
MGHISAAARQLIDEGMVKGIKLDENPSGEALSLRIV